MKFDTTKTKGGYKILSLHGPDEFDCYSGVVEADGSFIGLNWGRKGEELECQSEYDLIPLADEPKPDHTAVTDKLQYALDMCMDKLHDLDQRLALEMKRNDELYQDAVARVNGLRSDYLADQSAVQPSRVDALEERLDKFDDELGVLQDDVNLDLRLELRDLTKRLEALEQFKRATLAIREAVEQRTQPSDKGVWVTRESLKYAFDATQEFIMRNDRFKEIAERLGLEEEV